MRVVNIITATLVIAILISAFWSVHLQFQRRQNFAELKKLENARDALEIEWRRLQLEKSVLAAPERIEQIAKERLEFIIPNSNNLIVVGDQ